MQRRKFSREFKLEAVKLVRDRGVSVSQAARDLDVHENVLRQWVRDHDGDPGSAFHGHGVMKPEQQELERLRRENAKLKAERELQVGVYRVKPKGRLYIWTAEGRLYVAAVIDLFSRRVVGWSKSDTMTARLVTDTLVMAIRRRGKPDALLHHSDQGSQYTSEQSQRLMTDDGVTGSMRRSGNVWDRAIEGATGPSPMATAAMESVFSSLKTEWIARKTYRTRDQVLADVFDYIERFYNPTRRHSTLGYLSPMDFEKQAIVA